MIADLYRRVAGRGPIAPYGSLKATQHNRSYGSASTGRCNFRPAHRLGTTPQANTVGVYDRPKVSLDHSWQRRWR